MKATIHWKIGLTSGHGKPIDFKTAALWVEEMNRKFGSGTHWLVSDQEVAVINHGIVGEA